MDIDQFLNESGVKPSTPAGQDQVSTDIVVLNPQERMLVNRVFENLRVISPETMVGVATRIMDLERLSVSISRYPSMHQGGFTVGAPRNTETLVETLCTFGDHERLLTLPTKAILGKGFLVAKFHAFAAITKVALNSNFSDRDIQELRQATLNIMFTLMAEEVYMSILDDPNLNTDVRRDVAEALAELWEHRLDQHAISVAPVLDAVWSVRDQIAPNFGTMIGTSELLLITIALDETWQSFISQRLSNSDVGAALEEFLFGLSHEDISFIRNELKTRGISAVGRDEIPQILGHRAALSNEDPRIFYRAYTQRRNNADARKRLNAAGPRKTLEDHYMQYIFEQNRERQKNGK
ncbi:hypothetical protein [Teretinema zuelzerae]|uniref:hypothetical protein n=1 Tax=Teretinema zuelzerae TaxID=156 RepID=UPI001E5F1FD8|nr:hypothetical protein [Teretinema zuelzerae]